MMGACYSKNATGPRMTAGSKISIQKHRNGKWNTEKLSSENVPLKENEKSVKQKVESPNNITSRSSPSDLVCDHLYLKQVDHSIAPSDSGIESIGTLQEDAQGGAWPKQERDELLKRLDHQNLKVCHKCGHLKPHDFNLLPDSDILCGSYQTGKVADSEELVSTPQDNKITTAIGNIKCDPGTMVFPASKKTAAIISSSTRKDSSLKHNNSLQKPGLEIPVTVNKDRKTWLAQSSLTPSSKNKSENNASLILNEVEKDTKAPLAHFDSLDMNLNDPSKEGTSKKKSLFNGIQYQDITGTVCKCTPHSSEYTRKDHGENSTSIEGKQCILKPNTENGQFEGENEHLNHINITGQSHLKHSSIFCHGNTPGDSSSAKLSFNPEERNSYVPKNVSFDNHEEVKRETPTSPCKVKHIPVSKEAHASYLESSISESSSGVYTHKAASESFLSNKEKDMHPCSGSLVEALISDSNSNSLVCGTEDDMTSLDLDNISRFTSKSNSSSGRLMESTENIALDIPVSVVRPATINGVDCVIIPKETYHQLQSDLSLLKQQLLNLSSLMQESDELEQTIDSVGDM